MFPIWTLKNILPWFFQLSFDMCSETMSKKKVLELWRDPKFSGSYRGIKTFQLLLKTDKNIDISERELFKIMKNDPIYVMHMQPKKVLRRSYYVSNVGEIVQSDLAHMFVFDDFKYFIVFVDCYSFEVFIEALKNKKSETVLKAFEKFLKTSSIEKLETDMGTEYSLCKKLCKSQKILYSAKRGQNKANFAEFAILQIKKRLYKMLRGTLSKDWPSLLKQIQLDFNNTPLKKLGYYAPKDVKNVVDTYFVQKAQKQLNIKTIEIPTFQQQRANEEVYNENSNNLKVGDFVYLNFKISVFSKSFDIQVRV